MPRIPSEFVPGAALQDGALPPVQAPGEVVPMRSYAGEQQAEMGNSPSPSLPKVSMSYFPGMNFKTVVISDGSCA